MDRQTDGETDPDMGFCNLKAHPSGIAPPTRPQFFPNSSPTGDEAWKYIYMTRLGPCSLKPSHCLPPSTRFPFPSPQSTLFSAFVNLIKMSHESKDHEMSALLFAASFA